ncbi:MAG: FtsX-like permease family protein [Bacteroidota bacterium]
MNLLRFTWKNLRYRPLAMLLSLVLFSLGVGLISLLFLLEDQLQDNFEKNLAGVDLVIGAKGSPLQMILSSMYHIDAPTGNIPISEIRPFLNPKHPLIESALPISLGDSYRGFRIVGSSTEILDWYEASIAEGEIWTKNFDVTLGAAVAGTLDMKIGDRFKSSHGFLDDEDMAHDDVQDFVVRGILNRTGSVIDQLILTTPQTYWYVHEVSNEIDATNSDHVDHDHHSEVPLPLIEEEGSRDITNLLLRFRGHNFQALNMQRSINENTDMQAATPAIEINRLFALMDSGEKVLKILAYVIVLVSGLSIFIALFSSLRERRYELSLLRVMGAGKVRLFGMIILEGLFLAFIGYLIGTVLAHLGMEIIGRILSADYRYSFTGITFLTKELWLLAGALLIGLVASFIPAQQAAQTDIAETLSRG